MDVLTLNKVKIEHDIYQKLNDNSTTGAGIEQR